MRKKIISILLILIILTISLPIINIPVKAKTLYDWEDDWMSYWEVEWIGDTGLGEVIEYATLDDYLSEHYIDYENVDKSQITRLFIEGFSVYDIKDLSGLYDFPNLTELEIWAPVSQDAIKVLDFTKLTNLRKLALYDVDISNIELDKLSNLTYLYIDGVDTNFDSPLNLNNMKNLKHFECNLEIKEEIFVAKTVEEMKNKITPIEGYEVYATFGNYGAGLGGWAGFELVEKLNVNISTDKATYNLGDKVTATVSWDKGIQATDFEINFDSSKLKLEDSTIDEDYYNLVEPGRILVSWASFEEIDIQEITFEFSAIGDGQAEIIVLPENFADGNLDTDFIFAEGKQTITIEKGGYVKPNKEITTTVIDNKETITGLNVKDNKLTIQEFLEEDNFTENLEVKVFNSNDQEITDTSKGLGTGSKVKLYENGNVVKEFTVVVYGDTTGDGKIGANDALALIKAINQIIPFKTETHKEAARVMSGSGKEPNARDALAIVKSANYSYTINQSK